MQGVKSSSPAPERRSADPSPMAQRSVTVEVEVARPRSPEVLTRDVPAGTLVKELVRAAGQSPEGVAVLIDGVSVPLDLPVDRPLRLVVVPTFSGG